MTPAFIEAVLEDRREDAAAELGIELPDVFPAKGERSFLGLRLRQMREDERFETWCPNAVVLDGMMIGHAGYHGPPGSNSTQAALMLMDLAEQRAGTRHFVLSIAPDNDPSLAIARKLGFVKTGEMMDEEDGLEHIFELER